MVSWFRNIELANELILLWITLYNDYRKYAQVQQGRVSKNAGSPLYIYNEWRYYYYTFTKPIIILLWFSWGLTSLSSI